MKLSLVAALAVAAVGCGSPSPESTRTESSDLETNHAVNDALRCIDFGRYDASGAIVVDRTDGRMWQRDVVPVKLTQSDAIAYCSGLSLGDRQGWRLPDVSALTNIRLLPGLIKGGPGFCVPSIDQDAFPDTPAMEFWTSSTRPRGEGIYTDFADGRSHDDDPTELFYVRCMREADVTTSAATSIQAH
jgi:hypothetical protein